MNSLKLITLFLLATPIVLKAQPLLEHFADEGKNVRLAWAPDLNGGPDDGEFEGFEVAYASEIYPLDQMVISYGYSNPDENSLQSIMISIEEFYPITETFKFYGIAGIGHMWSDDNVGISGDSRGWYGKLGFGGIFELNDRFDLYAEIAYLASEQYLWVDGSNTVDSTNVNGLLGFRFKY